MSINTARDARAPRRIGRVRPAQSPRGARRRGRKTRGRPRAPRGRRVRLGRERREELGADLGGGGKGGGGYDGRGGRGLEGAYTTSARVCGNARIEGERRRGGGGIWGSEARRPGRTRTWLPHCPSWTVTTEPGIARGACARRRALQIQTSGASLGEDEDASENELMLSLAGAGFVARQLTRDSAFAWSHARPPFAPTVPRLPRTMAACDSGWTSASRRSARRPGTSPPRTGSRRVPRATARAFETRGGCCSRHDDVPRDLDARETNYDSLGAFMADLHPADHEGNAIKAAEAFAGKVVGLYYREALPRVRAVHPDPDRPRRAPSRRLRPRRRLRRQARILRGRVHRAEPRVPARPVRLPAPSRPAPAVPNLRHPRAARVPPGPGRGAHRVGTHRRDVQLRRVRGRVGEGGAGVQLAGNRGRDEPPAPVRRRQAAIRRDDGEGMRRRGRRVRENRRRRGRARVTAETASINQSQKSALITPPPFRLIPTP